MADPAAPMPDDYWHTLLMNNQGAMPVFTQVYFTDSKGNKNRTMHRVDMDSMYDFQSMSADSSSIVTQFVVACVEGDAVYHPQIYDVDATNGPEEYHTVNVECDNSGVASVTL